MCNILLLQTKVICLSWMLKRVKAAAIWASLHWPAGSLKPANREGEVNYPHWLVLEVVAVQDSFEITKVMIHIGTAGLILLLFFLRPNGGWKLRTR